ncbi:MAG TPA: alcohol dehydrogenase catalytic domain-containing protein [Planctomycetota bacterium]|nr:alcohol dehydrogenase catalytic domain-containing protein [Planctomycetota bacterium]
MRALSRENGVVGVVEREIPRRPGEALVRVRLSGVCNTDLEIARGYADFTGTLGHEFVGVVEEAAAAPETVGRRVVGEINVGCGACALCRGGDARHCPSRTVLGIVGRDGAHAEYVALPATNLLVVPDSVADETAVFAEPLAAALGMSERVDFGRGRRVAVVGDGKLGILCAWAAQNAGADVLLLGRHASKLERAARLGVRGETSDDAGRLRRAFDVVVEASGAESGFALATTLARPRGTIVLKSTFHGAPTWEAWKVVVDELSVVGSRCGRLGPALDVLASGALDVASLIDDVVPLGDAPRALARAAERGVLKVLLRAPAP